MEKLPFSSFITDVNNKTNGKQVKSERIKFGYLTYVYVDSHCVGFSLTRQQTNILIRAAAFLLLFPSIDCSD